MPPTPTQHYCEPIAIGVDVGGTKIEAVMVDLHGNVLASQRTPTHRGNAAVLHDITMLCQQLIAARPGATAQSIGIGIPGQVDSDSGVIHSAVNLGISEFAVADEAAALLHAPVHVENDVNAAALGAMAVLGVSTRPNVADAFINLGTGLAAGIIRSGRIDHGATGICGEIGHIAVEPHRFACPCGQRGCLETVASGSAVERLWPVKHGAAMPDLMAKAQTGDAKANEMLDMVVAGVCRAVQITALCVDPATIIIGGGLTRAGQPFFDRITAMLRELASGSAFLTSAAIDRRIIAAPAGRPIGAIGAAKAAFIR
ncbi:ROK family protein [Bifidobacterium sp.]|uniref:ROK family protein n=1 Tax=Bifidobacterium sp. TaxID=41200 RepID=UPI0025B96BDD|nr:ROK family protein [Bifidobacterium sp.]MCI1224044.1 ROK family protein [Bifidobacterium sp.]